MIENTQRNLHIALMNDLAILFYKLGIDTLEVLGLAFKENCPDLWNTRVVNIVEAHKSYNARVDACDPWVDAEEAKHESGLNLTTPGQGGYDAVVVAVGHEEFKKLGAAGIRAHGKPGAVFYEVKYVLPRESVDGRL